MQHQKDTLQEVRRRHLYSLIDLQYEQLKALHEMRTDHLNKQHSLEWDNQIAYSKKAEKELRKKHLLELKQHPKSLKVYHSPVLAVYEVLASRDRYLLDQVVYGCIMCMCIILLSGRVVKG